MSVPQVMYTRTDMDVLNIAEKYLTKLQ